MNLQCTESTVQGNAPSEASEFLSAGSNQYQKEDKQNVAYVQVRLKGTHRPEGQWVNTDLHAGSTISVSPDILSPNYWIWERTRCDSNGIVWSFKSRPNSDLYIGIDDAENLVITSATDRSFFTVSGGDRGGVVFYLHGNPSRRIGLKEGQLALTNTMTEWDIKLKVQTSIRGELLYIMIIKASNSSRKWGADFLVPGASILATEDYYESKRSHWLSEFNPEKIAWRFRPVEDRGLLITTNVLESTLTLESEDPANGSSHLIRSSGSDSVIMSPASVKEGSYIGIDNETSTLKLEKEKLYAMSWSLDVYGFEVAGEEVPSV